MEQFKIDNFVRAFGNGFPDYRCLSGTECADLFSRLATRLGLPTTIQGLDLLIELSKLGVVLPGVSAESDDFVLSRTISDSGIVSEPSVFLNWYRFDNVDQLQLTDLTKYFDDIWYPAADDIDVFDTTLSWVISIRHDGMVFLVRL